MNDPLPEISGNPPAPGLAARAVALLQRFPWVLPLGSFIFGWASYWLVDRGNPHVARVIAALALIGWPWLWAESVLGKILQNRTRGFLSVGVIRYITQSLQLEMLFFSLPFLIKAAQPDAGHFVFTGLAALAAVACSIDPVYARYIGERPFASVLFHAFCNFIGALIVLPIAAQLSLEVSLPLAFALTGTMLVLSLPRALFQAEPMQRLVRLLVLAAVLPLVWSLRAEIPAAALRVSNATLAQTFSEPLVPGPPFGHAEAASLHEHGAIAFAAIRAPAGLSQSVVFVWRQNGAEVDRIPASINGGREGGYRVYSRKHAFPEDPRGEWAVDLCAPDGRLIYRWRFTVS